MKPPSKAASAHDGCHLFKLDAETRNQIYELVFTIETNEDDSISLNEDTMVPSNALTGTCQQIYNESREMWRAAYHDYPTKRTFSIDVTDRKRPYIPELGREFFVRMSSFCVIWRADEYNDGNPLLLTASFSRRSDSGSNRGDWETHVDINDKTWRPQDPRWNADRVAHCCAADVQSIVNEFYLSRYPLRGRVSSATFANTVFNAVYPPNECDLDISVWGVVRQ